MTEKVYYDKDADLHNLSDKAVGVIGYGIQGRAQALNLRDSGINVSIGNRGDAYAEQAVRDGFEVRDIAEVAKKADIILFLIPDQAQREIYESHIKGFIRSGSMLVFAHGFALRYKTINISQDIDVGMLAPRMPGHHIRENFLSGGGVSAFIDVAHDATGMTKKLLLSLAKAIGFTRAGVLEVSYAVEADLDLFTEQFLVASLVETIHTGFKVLVEEFGYPPAATLMELYASGELAEVLKLASQMGIGKVFQVNASPTCQYGIASHFNPAAKRDPAGTARRIFNNIQNGKFAKDLDREGRAGYPAVRDLWKTVDSKTLVETQEWVNKKIKRTGV